MKNLLLKIWVAALVIIPLLAIINIALHTLNSSDWDPPAALARGEAYQVEIIRDKYGVPHIYGARDADVAFGLAYAHAEDDFQTMQSLLPFYRGALGRTIGFDGLPIDFLVQWLDIRAHVEAHYETELTPEIRAICKPMPTD